MDIAVRIEILLCMLTLIKIVSIACGMVAVSVSSVIKCSGCIKRTPKMYNGGAVLGHEIRLVFLTSVCILYKIKPKTAVRFIFFLC